MNYLIAVLALALLVVCFDVAKKMDLRTWKRNPGMCIAVIVIGIGCAFSIAEQHAIGLAIVLAGRLVFRIFDKRAPFYVESDGTAACDNSSVVPFPNTTWGRAVDVGGQNPNGDGRGLHISRRNSGGMRSVS